MPGIKALRKLQLGPESTAGTAVAATAIWRGLGTIQDARPVTFVDEDVGLISRVDRTHIAQYDASLSLSSIEATFEQLPYLGEMGIKLTTAAADTGTGYVYQYTAPTTAQPTIRTYTIEGGDDQQAEEMEYCYVESLTLEGNAGEAVMMSAEVKGRQVTNTTFTAALSVSTVEDILTSKGKLYIDAVGGTIGSTQVSNTLIAFTLNWATGLQAVWTVDGNLYFSFVKSTSPEITLNVTFEHNASAVTEKTNWRNETPRLIRLIFEGSALGTPGAYTYKTLIIDLAGKWESFDALGDQDGNDIVTATFRARYNATAAFFAEILLVNELSALP